MPSLSEFFSSLSSAAQELDEGSTVHVCVGTEACDLDSIACSVLLAHYIRCTHAGTLSLPVLQCSRVELPLRTDAYWLLKEVELDTDALLFAEDVPVDRLLEAGSLSVSLVDLASPRGWVAPLADHVSEVIDHHRPMGEEKEMKGVARTVEMVGSCSTLVAEKLLTDSSYPLEALAATLLLAAILIDTGDLAETEGRATEKDREMAARLEPLSSIPRATLFQKLSSARFDVSRLSTAELLGRDYKEVQLGRYTLGFSSITCLASDLFMRPDVAEQLEGFSSSHRLHALILVAVAISPEGVKRRQIALYQPQDPPLTSGSGSELADALASVLEADEELKCERVNDTPHHWPLLEQHNTTLTRKHILPCIASFLREMEEGEEQDMTAPHSVESTGDGQSETLEEKLTFDEEPSATAVLSVSSSECHTPLEPTVNVIHGPEHQVQFRSEGGAQPQAIPEYSRKEEAIDIRKFRSVNVDGDEVMVNMELIEPYRNLIQHGGYIGSQRQAMMIISACYLPPRNTPNYSTIVMHLFYYVLSVVDQLVMDDYIIIYLHSGAPPHSMPALGLLHRFYTMIDRRLRKQLMHLYIVHPSFWVKTMLRLARPFISGKFYRKVHFIRTLQDLSVHAALEPRLVPAPVLRADNLLMPRPPPQQRYAAEQPRQAAAEPSL